MFIFKRKGIYDLEYFEEVENRKKNQLTLENNPQL